VIKEGGFHLEPLSIKPSYGRTSPRYVAVLVRLIVWRLFIFIFFKLLGLGEVRQIFLRVRAQAADNFLRIFLRAHRDFWR